MITTLPHSKVLCKQDCISLCKAFFVYLLIPMQTICHQTNQQISTQKLAFMQY